MINVKLGLKILFKAVLDFQSGTAFSI